MGFFGKLFQNAKESLSDTKLYALANNRQFMEGAMAWAAAQAWADGELEDSEKAKLVKFIERHESLKHFDKSQCVAAFKKISDAFEFDSGMGKAAAIKQIKQVTDPEQKHLMALLAMAISNADGEFEPSEQKMFAWVCDQIGLDARSYAD